MIPMLIIPDAGEAPIAETDTVTSPRMRISVGFGLCSSSASVTNVALETEAVASDTSVDDPSQNIRRRGNVLPLVRLAIVSTTFSDKRSMALSPEGCYWNNSNCRS